MLLARVLAILKCDLPWSNAELFSQVQLVKNTLKNKLHLKTLSAILSIRLV